MLSSKEAIDYVMQEYGYTSYYSISAELSKSDIKVQPIQISNYHKGKRTMSEKVAIHFEEVFGIYVADFHRSQGRPAVW